MARGHVGWNYLFWYIILSLYPMVF